jgi:hypothetical protein
MDALTNASALLDFLMEYKTTIKMLNSEKRVKLCNGILLVGIACDVIGMNIQSRYKLSEVLEKYRANAPLVADSLNTFVKRDVADTLSDVFSVKTNIEQYVGDCTEEQRMAFAEDLRLVAKAYNSFVTACLAM